MCQIHRKTRRTAAFIVHPVACPDASGSAQNKTGRQSLKELAAGVMNQTWAWPNSKSWSYISAESGMSPESSSSPL